jgi:hypothetical protein
MYVRVKRKKQTFFLHVEPSDTVLEVKQKLQELVGQVSNKGDQAIHREKQGEDLGALHANAGIRRPLARSPPRSSSCTRARQY